MLDFLIRKYELGTSGCPKPTGQGDHTDKFFQNDIRSIDECLLTYFTAGNFGFDFASFTYDMT